jgi:ribosome biogenesis GTPase / thiamine phosphate phosphatase
LTLIELGWGPDLTEHFQEHAAAGLVAGRVAVPHRGSYLVLTDDGELTAEISGKLRHEAAPGELPAAGDWVAVAARPEEGTGTIHAVLPRRSAVIRKAAGNPTEAQVVGANIDTVFLVTSLNDDLNLRRLERYLATAWESGAQPAILLTKADLCDDPAAAVLEVQAIAYGVPVHSVSTVTGEGIDELGAYLGAGKTVALIGSSGVGKSTLVNRLAGREVLATQEIRESDGRGRHTTSHRELVLLPGGGLVLDTPGMRELQLWESSDGMQEAFEDVEELVDACRFADCGHGVEPGCAVQAALADGTLAAERYESWVKLQRELEHLELKQGGRALAEARKARRAFARKLRTTAW